jgi:YesN/AraC family two-component response regulator
MGPTSKDAVLSALGHIVDELLQQRETGRRTLAMVTKMVKRQDEQEEDHAALADKVSKLPRYANGHGSD